ncbi:MAG: phosphatidate cytidylyltransferase [Flavobacteriia bacterium]|nr:phosphatidate cytidylyltransferase [Flavobacteriia bacterium]
MSNILLRAITGFFFVVLVIASLWFGTIPTVIVSTIFFVLGLIEFTSIFKHMKQIQLFKNYFIFISIILYTIIILAYLNYIDFVFLSIIPLLIFSFFLVELWRKKENPILNIGIHLLGVFYLVLPFSLIIILNEESTERNPLVIGMFLLIWSNDTFAYLSGRFFGKTKLFERISPKKTWEGTIGGILLTMIIGFLISFWGDNNDFDFWLIAALIVAPAAIFGDLIESLFKRSLNIKDSGTILPGHGGILDRFDAAIFTIPFFYSWFIIYNYF